MNISAKAAVIALTGLAAVVATPAAAQTPALFNTVEYRTDNLDKLPKWQATLQKIAKESRTYAASSSKAVRAWQAMIRDNKGARRIDQLHAVNGFVNQWRYRTDSYNYKQSDYWASPAAYHAHRE